MAQKGGIGSHTKPNQGETNIWLTPEFIPKALGRFDLDPCAAPSPRPWGTAQLYYELPFDGLALPWSGQWCVNCGAIPSVMCTGSDYPKSPAPFIASTYTCSLCAGNVSHQPYRVFLNPPYGKETDAWLEKLSKHKSGIALIFARTETSTWTKHVWPKAHSIFFFDGRLWFHRPDGTRGTSNAGGPSALISYSYFDTEAIRLAWETGLKGTLVEQWVGRSF